MFIADSAQSPLQPMLRLTLLALLLAASPSQSSAQSLPVLVPDMTQPASISSQAEASYTLGGGDRIRINIFRVPQYSGDTEVLVDGTLNLPVAGTVSVQGLTLEQAAGAIAVGYQRILRQPLITVSLLAPRPLQIGVAGEVGRPGTYTLALEGTQFPTVTRLLEMAGGTTQSADLRQVQIRRSSRSGNTQVMQIDLWQLLRTGELNHDISLRDGDTVIVPTASEINLDESLQMASATFASQSNQPINIAVVGEVYRPGPYTVTGGTARTGDAGLPGGASGGGRSPTVTRAIQVAGGIKPMANIRQIQVNRPTRNGETQAIQVDLWALLQAGDLRQDLILQEGDTISIPTVTEISSVEATQLAVASFSPDKIRVNVVGEVGRAGVVEVPPNTPLNQALLAAGGFNNRAARGTVELVRLNPDGSVSRRSIPVDFAQGISEDNNPSLSNNDVIIVGRSSLASISDTLGTALSPLSNLFTLFQFPFQFLRIFN